MKRLIRACLLSVLCVIPSLSQTLPAAELKGDYQQGSHNVDGQNVKLFAFTFMGTLSGQAIEPETFKVLRQLENSKTTAVRVSKTPYAPYRTPVSLKKGEIFVFGWWNTNKNTYAWIAADSNGATYPIHRWLSNDGAYGFLDTSSGEKHTIRTWKLDGQHVTEFELDAGAGWLKWYVTAPGG
jgi:hypothetical protein